MGALMILNPRASSRTRRSGGRKTKRPMTAKQLKYFGPRRAKTAKAAAGTSRKRKGARAKVVIITQNPRGQTMAAKRRRKSHKKKSFLSNPRKRKSAGGLRRFKRNPRIPGASLFNNAIVPAAIGAGGALMLDVALSMAPLPGSLRRGMLVPVVKIAGAMLLGYLVGAVTSRETGEEVAAGGIVVTLYGLARNFMLTRVPSVPLNRYVPLARAGAGGQRTMRRYVPLQALPPGAQNRGNGGLAYINPARQAGGLTRGALRGMM